MSIIKLLAFEWKSFSQTDLEIALAECGVEIGRFMYQFDIIQEDPYFDRNFQRILRDGSYQGVISWNFWPLVAEACHQVGVPYIAWVYDCPIAYDIKKWAMYPTSHVFIFDKAEFEKYRQMGLPHVYHHQLAVNIKRLEELDLTDEDENRFGCEISFLGSMYDSMYEDVSKGFSAYEVGYLDAVIRSQQCIYGADLIESTLSGSFIEQLQSELEENGTMQPSDPDVFREWFYRMVSKKVSRSDRITLLSELGVRHKVRYFSYQEYPEIRGAVFSGPLSYNEDMFKMFKASRINLNITARQIPKGISLRALDIMGAGGFLLSNWQEELVENFEPGVDFVCYDSISDAVEKCEYYLNHEQERLEIARNGHETVKKFDYSIQLKKVLDTVFPA